MQKDICSVCKFAFGIKVGTNSTRRQPWLSTAERRSTELQPMDWALRCYRFPPIRRGNDIEADLPYVETDSWCGEFMSYEA